MARLEEIQQNKIRLAETLRQDSFLNCVSRLDPDIEQCILRALLTAHAALAVRTIRNEYIQSVSRKKNVGSIIAMTMPTEHSWDISEIKKACAPSNADAALRKAFIPPVVLLEAGITPLSDSERIVVLEKALKEKLGVKIPSWDAIDNALESLVEDGYVEKRSLKGKHRRSDTLYYVSPILYAAWEAWKRTVEGKAKLTDAEKSWL